MYDSILIRSYFQIRVLVFLAGLICTGMPVALSAQTVTQVAELKPAHYSSFFGNSQDPILHPDGFVFIGREWQRSAEKKVTGVIYAFVNLRTQKTGTIQLPYAKLVESNKELLTRGRSPSTSLVAFDGRRAGFVLEDSRRAKRESCVFHGWDRRFYYFTLDTKSGEVSALREIGAPGGRESFYIAGSDKRHLYYSTYSNDGGCGQYKSVQMRRISLQGEIDGEWAIDLKTRGVIAKPRFTSNRKHLAILTYTERGVPAKNPPDGYIIDPVSRKTWRFTIPVTPYAIACDETQCLLGSSQAGTVVRLRLDTKKVEPVAKGLRLMNHFVVTPDGDRVLIFWNSISGPKHVQIRDFPAMNNKNVRKLATGKIFGAPRGFRPESMVWSADGRYLLIPKPGPTGFSDDESILIFEVKD